MTFPLNCLILLLFMPQQLDLRRIVGNPSRTATITPRGLRDLKPQRQAGTRRTEAEAATRTRTLDRARALVNEIIAASYPELKSTAIRIKLFESKSDYFKARFGVPQFFLGPMQYSEERASKPQSDCGQEIDGRKSTTGGSTCKTRLTESSRC